MSKKVLIVEDESIISFGYRIQLEGMGFQVIGTPKSAAEAEMAMNGERPDFLIMDIRIKGERSGLELVEDLHKRGETIPAIFLTASINPDNISRIGQLEKCTYIPKPVSGSRLREALALHAA